MGSICLPICCGLFSRDIDITFLNQPTIVGVVTHLKSIFACHGTPETLISDNGPQYSCEDFTEFVKEYEFQHVIANPYHSHGNIDQGRRQDFQGGVSNDPSVKLRGRGYATCACTYWLDESNVFKRGREAIIYFTIIGTGV